AQAPGTEVRVISGSYFPAMGIPLIKGRAFDEHDGRDSHVLVVNETFARRFFPNEDAVGKRVVINWAPVGEPPVDEIIGVVGDIRETALERDPNPAIYWPLTREPYPFMNLVVRSAIDPMQLVASI